MDRVANVVRNLLDDPLVRARAAAGVWLFGSYAHGTQHDDSDVDLAILCTPSLGLDRTVLADRLAIGAKCEVDLVDLATAPPSLAWEVITTGRLVAELDELAVEDFVRRARWAAEDDEHRSRMILSAQLRTTTGHVR